MVDLDGMDMEVVGGSNFNPFGEHKEGLRYIVLHYED